MKQVSVKYIAREIGAKIPKAPPVDKMTGIQSSIVDLLGFSYHTQLCLHARV